MKGLQDISAKQQTYIESIDELLQTQGTARSVDLARKLGVSLPSVSEAVGRLVKQGLVLRPSWHELRLSEHGAHIAELLSCRHETLMRFMVDVLSMDPDEAEHDACRAEHFISREFTNRLTCFADFLADHLPAKTRKEWEQHIREMARTNDH